MNPEARRELERLLTSAPPPPWLEAWARMMRAKQEAGAIRQLRVSIEEDANRQLEASLRAELVPCYRCGDTPRGHTRR